MAEVVVVQESIAVRAPRRGLHDITTAIRKVVEKSGVVTGLCSIFVTHTSASLLIQENADPSARRDLEDAFSRFVPEDVSLYTHTAEGPDDMTSHIRSALTQTSETVPIVAGQLGLGTWQGIYLFEHRHGHRERTLVVTAQGLTR